ncbi:restriction endonuclease [Candidatus Bathycorpusculum sp.]|uniref:restriction endonuclease n=1 Tax=Candidatus Bathycorpusculum sp. TaxID=2994959 RepID=UPI00283157FE|nr:restriction endonuclease [Candidatus Termitimicrobium sp.]MCL2684920.1 restriction endonuclease [Candidatus Termitimicrobium sp.]
MSHQKNNTLKKIAEQPKNNDLIELLADELQLPLDKAEILANRIKKTPNLTPQKPSIKTLVEKHSKPEPQTANYSIGVLSDKEFRLFIQWLFETLGYEIQSSCVVNHGADLVTIKNAEKIAVLARKYPPSYTLSDVIILAAQQAQSTQKCDRALIIATTSFTEQATQEAQRCRVELWNNTALTTKIEEAKDKLTYDNPKISFQPYQGSLLLSLLSLAETKTFLVEPRTEGKYDLILPGVKYPLLTFEARNGTVVQCVFRIEYNEPVSESDGEQLIGTDENGNKKGPEDLEAYELITQYLTQFIE